MNSIRSDRSFGTLWVRLKLGETTLLHVWVTSLVVTTFSSCTDSFETFWMLGGDGGGDGPLTPGEWMTRRNCWIHLRLAAGVLAAKWNRVTASSEIIVKAYRFSEGRDNSSFDSTTQDPPPRYKMPKDKKNSKFESRQKVRHRRDKALGWDDSVAYLEEEHQMIHQIFLMRDRCYRTMIRWGLNNSLASNM